MSTEEARRLAELPENEFNNQFISFLESLPSVDDYRYYCPECKDKVLREDGLYLGWYCDYCSYHTIKQPSLATSVTKNK